jgi:hypothetical protein
MVFKGRVHIFTLMKSQSPQTSFQNSVINMYLTQNILNDQHTSCLAPPPSIMLWEELCVFRTPKTHGRSNDCWLPVCETTYQSASCPCAPLGYLKSLWNKCRVSYRGGINLPLCLIEGGYPPPLQTAVFSKRWLYASYSKWTDSFRSA